MLEFVQNQSTNSQTQLQHTSFRSEQLKQNPLNTHPSTSQKHYTHRNKNFPQQTQDLEGKYKTQHVEDLQQNSLAHLSAELSKNEQKNRNERNKLKMKNVKEDIAERLS